MSGAVGNYAANTAINCTIDATDLKTARISVSNV